LIYNNSFYFDQKNKILGVYRQRAGFVARSRPIRSLGRIQIIEKENNVYIQSRRGEWRNATKIFKSDYGPNIYVVDDGKIKKINVEEDTGECKISSAENFLKEI